MITRRLSRVRVLAALLAVLLTGCVSLPGSSSVSAARGAGLHRGPSLIRNSPPGPQPGAGRADIVAGYLQAMLAFPSNPSLVREFMTPSAAQAWSPDQQTQVYSGPTLAVAGTTVHLSATLLGSLDVRGSWTSSANPPPKPLSLQVERVSGGEFRIANPMAGTLINTEHFSRYYHQYSLYYYDPTNTVLAPDPVYLQVGDPGTTATALVHDLLLGPTEGMAHAVQSAAPVGTRLAPGVTVSTTGVADVPLTGNFASVDGPRFLLLASELAWTLRQQRVGVNHISISVNGRTRAVQGHGSVFAVAAFHDQSIGPGSRTLYALSDKGRLYAVPTNAPATQVTGPISAADIAARSVAVNGSGEFAALVSGDGTKVVVGGLTPAQSDSPVATWFRGGSNLLRPSWDASGLLWLADVRGPSATLLRVATKSQSRLVHAPDLDGLDIRAFALSRDGVRFAAVVGTGENSQLAVAMIKRDTNPKNSTHVSLEALRYVVNSDFHLSHINGLAWVNATTVVVLARDQSSELQPYEVSIDGSHVQPTPGSLPTHPVSVAAGTGASVVIGSADGALYYHNSDQQWPPVYTTKQLLGPPTLPRYAMYAPVYPG